MPQPIDYGLQRQSVLRLTSDVHQQDGSGTNQGQAPTDDLPGRQMLPA